MKLYFVFVQMRFFFALSILTLVHADDDDAPSCTQGDPNCMFIEYFQSDDCTGDLDLTSTFLVDNTCWEFYDSNSTTTSYGGIFCNQEAFGVEWDCNEDNCDSESCANQYY